MDPVLGLEGSGLRRNGVPLWEQDWLIWLTAACVGLPLSIMMFLAIDAAWYLRAVAAAPFLVSLVAGYLIRALGRFVERLWA